MNFISKNIDSLLLMDWQTISAPGDALRRSPPSSSKTIWLIRCLVIFDLSDPLVLLHLAQHIFIQSELYSPKKLDQWLMWTIMASICGTIIGTGVVACIAVLRDREGGKRA